METQGQSRVREANPKPTGRNLSRKNSSKKSDHDSGLSRRILRWETKQHSFQQGKKEKGFRKNHRRDLDRNLHFTENSGLGWGDNLKRNTNKKTQNTTQKTTNPKKHPKTKKTPTPKRKKKTKTNQPNQTKPQNKKKKHKKPRPTQTSCAEGESVHRRISGYQRLID